MNLANRDITLLSNPVGIDYVIQNIQLALSSIPWLQKSFGKSLRYTEEREGSDYLIPKTYYKNKEYTPLDPDDTVKAFSFLYEDDPSSVTGIGKTRINTTLNLVVFANLKLIDTKDELFIEELINDVYSVLLDRKNMKVYNSIDNVNNIFKWLPNAYADFSISTEKKWIKENYASFRISIDVVYKQKSYDCLHDIVCFLIDNEGYNMIDSNGIFVKGDCIDLNIT